MDAKDAKLAGLVGRLKEAAHENLEAVILYGSAARGDYHAGQSDLNVVCVMRSLAAAELKRVAPAIAWWVKEQKEPAPLLFTEKELHESADVFAIELTDLQRKRQVLYGTDVIATIHVPMNLHRVQVEHELRTMLLKLRQHFLLSVGDTQTLRAVMAKSVASARTLSRHALIAMGEAGTGTAREVFAQIAAKTGVDETAFETAREMREPTGNRQQEADLVSAYGEYLKAIEGVTEALDRHAPKNEWRRAAH
jgi:predicted nucleotidyltransferase